MVEYKKTDVFVSLEYNMKTAQATIVNTNVKPEFIDEGIFSNWLRGQLGQGEDKSPANEQEVYHIKIGVDLSYDIFRLISDTGNKSLTCGIIRNSINKWVLGKSLLEELSDKEFERLKKENSHMIPLDYTRLKSSINT